MGKKHYNLLYPFGVTSESNVIKAKASNVAVHFKNAVETVSQLRGMKLNRANRYLNNVMNFRECVPFKRYRSGIGRCAQAKKNIQGRWPVKVAKVLLDLLKNVASNCEYFGKDPEEYVIGKILVQAAPVRRRRTYRAHGRINPYKRRLCHIIMLLQAIDEVL